jgi:prophage DNA circulation protein
MHPFLVISTKVERKTRTLYVPVAMEETALAWVRNFRAARRLVAELSSLSEDLIRTHAGRARAASRRAVRGGSSAPGTP